MPKSAEDKTPENSAQAFWDEHVCRREPKLFGKMPTTQEWNTTAWVKDFPQYFKKRAVSVALIVMGSMFRL